MLNIILYGGLFAVIIILTIMSLYVRDFGFIMNHPFDFSMELLFVSIIPALLMVFIFSRTRMFTREETVTWFLTVLLKLMIFHILLQLSGIYTHMFGSR